MSRRRRARVVLPLDEAPLIPTRTAFWSVMISRPKNPALSTLIELFEGPAADDSW